MTFNLRKDLPLKYLLEMHAALPSYPTRQDFVFEILTYLVRVSESKSKDWDSTDIKFSTKTLKYVFGDKINDENFKESLKLLMKDLIEDNTISKKGEYLVISESEFQKYYQAEN